MIGASIYIETGGSDRLVGRVIALALAMETAVAPLPPASTAQRALLRVEIQSGKRRKAQWKAETRGRRS